jgi:outer membrane protein assembly factor BamA
MRRYLTIIILLLCNLFSFGQVPDTVAVWQIDSIQINKNWRTRDKIIMRELQFSAGEKVDQNRLETSISQVWNIGSFAEVDYTLDSISPNGHLLNLTARDAFNLVPYVTFNGSKDDNNISIGFSDNNFLGRNINLELQGNIGTYNSNYSAGIKIPRQLLYKNMTLSFDVSSGNANNYRYENDKQVSVIAYQTKQFSGGIGNPFHTDYEYTFSPNFSWNLFRMKLVMRSPSI